VKIPVPSRKNIASFGRLGRRHKMGLPNNSPISQREFLSLGRSRLPTVCTTKSQRWLLLKLQPALQQFGNHFDIGITIPQTVFTIELPRCPTESIFLLQGFWIGHHDLNTKSQLWLLFLLESSPTVALSSLAIALDFYWTPMNYSNTCRGFAKDTCRKWKSHDQDDWKNSKEA
jgi:hypothetical protein